MTRLQELQQLRDRMVAFVESRTASVLALHGDTYQESILEVDEEIDFLQSQVEEQALELAKSTAWQMLKDGHQVKEVVDKLAEMFGFTPYTASFIIREVQRKAE